MKCLTYTLFLFLILSCNNQNQAWDPAKGEDLLNRFYERFYEQDEMFPYTDMADFLSNDFYNLLNSFNDTNQSGDEIILDFDPFIVGQDYDPESIKKSLKITPLEDKNQFEVSLKTFEEAEPSIIQYQLKENGNGNLVIDNILNNDLFVIGFENK